MTEMDSDLLEMDDDVDERIPVTILTRFFGSGKTTLLKRILSESHGQRIAVIENEFGEEGIDDELLFAERGEQLIEMNNGCICCSVRGDLIRILGKLATQRSSGEIDFDRVVIETTGLADPGPVAQTFFVDPVVADAYRLDAILTVVDALHAPRQLDEHAEIQEQIGFADRLLISKRDLVDDDTLSSLQRRLTQMNPRAPVLAADFGRAPLDQLLDIHGFDLERLLELEPDFLESDHHHSHNDVKSFVNRSQMPFDMNRFDPAIQDLIGEYGTQLLRYKGVLHIKDETCRGVLQGVHMLAGATLDRPWEDGEPRASTIVFIGRDLPRVEIVDRLDACLA
jgi:G3E family GTPase